MGIAECMRRYQLCKREYRSTQDPDWKLDMEYWRQRLLAAGAMSLYAAAPPPTWLGGPEHPIWKKRRERAMKRVKLMDLEGLPVHPT